MSDIDLVMPLWGGNESEGTIAQWFCANGELVGAGAVVAEIELDKVTMELESPVKGILTVLVDEGQTVMSGTVVARLTPSRADTTK